MNYLAIRADGDSEIGYGHLVRSSVLAQKFLQNGYQVTYLTQTPSAVSNICPDEVETFRLKSEGIEETLLWIKKHEPTIVLTDSYEVDTKSQKQISKSPSTLVTITDDTRFKLCCDVNVNGNVYAPELNYDWIGEKPQMLLGPDYLLMREEFQHLATKTPPWRDPPERALITFGGSDVNDVTPDAIRAFDGFDIEIDVIIGPGFENQDQIKDAAESTNAELNLLQNPDDLSQRMFKADFAVSATGSTVYELLATGTPIIGIPQSDNQRPVANSLSDSILQCERDELRESVLRLVTDSDLRRTMKESGEELVDARGIQRIYSMLTG
ncbi:UDP-2,4-diacetamido-2,4,6-trideoxy-beta-L-altropyranose hydrolase [Halobellus litoreus]|uniref:UDP-2,4-diacetamido-2,4, 6-trideoxy-beta-L-altropyranose hydrolase n=1 Tax=Halobellus litoreus TaxID=755310 RepID=A0ABD6DXC4_9EURY|nr:UDP-2,4-diacetamido-2,4,6-trideoxy-beta-L-altropyranose hydrolase [Halobellus litoreus]